MLSRFALKTLLVSTVLSLVVGTADAEVNATTLRVMQGLANPVYMTYAPGDNARLFVVEQGAAGTARIKIYDIASQQVSTTPFLTITGISTGGERGLLGLAFDPSYATNGNFYVYVSNSGAANSVRRYTVMSGNPDQADPASMLPILVMSDPFGNHNGGWIAFGPDGFLYVATGDGGSANDPQGNGQNNDQLLGKMLRIDPNGADAFPGDPNKNYAIPPGNPFIGVAGEDEIWFTGLRNPWRASFDRSNGDFWIGDVGQNAWEEIDYVPAGQSGNNFGWRCKEGNSCTGLSGCSCTDPTLTNPVHVYSHGFGCSVTGGYRYRGSALCGWQGLYIFADYCSGRIWTGELSGGALTNVTPRQTELAPGGGQSINQIVSFAEDQQGELYIVDQGGGEIYQIIASSTQTDCNTNGTADACDIQNGTSQDGDGDGVPDECQPTVTPYCFGDGTGTACPCGNTGATGHGCASALVPAGGLLSSFGPASLNNDGFTLVGTDMPDGMAVYFQGTAEVNGGAGSIFGDGLRCAGGTVIRLATKVNVGGQSSYPEIFDLPISIAGNISGAPQTRTYQVWYRNSSQCSNGAFNLTNALSVVWVN
jgi:glucose/arabinose dehydrogenase